MGRRLLLLGLLSGLVIGCSGIKPYRSDHPKNLIISTQTESSGFLSSVRASLDIYSMEPDCNAQYQGTVDLEDPRVEVGIPTGQPAYLVFNFSSAAFLANSRSDMSYDVVLSPEAGSVYDLDVTYRDNIYNVAVGERSAGVTEGREMVLRMQDRDCAGNS